MAKFEVEIDILTAEEAGITVTEAMRQRAQAARQATRDNADPHDPIDEREAG